MKRKIVKSLYDWCIENDRNDVLEKWDYMLNNCTPKDITYGSCGRYFFKCPKGIHESELKKINNITSKNRNVKCDYCNSFGQYLIDNYGKNALNEYWDYDKNEINPFKIASGYNGKVWIKCQEKDYHGSYQIKCCDFIKGNRCSYCGCRKTHPKDSFAQYHIDNTDPDFVEKYWSKKNTLDPFGISPKSDKKVLIICQEKDYHGDYEIACKDFTRGNRCHYCVSQKVHPQDSFGQWLINTFGEDALKKYWDYRNNKENPFEIAKTSHKKVWIICQENNYHESYEIHCCSFYNGSRCPYCSSKKVHPKDSFAQYHIDNTDKDFVEKYWSSKNTISPFTISTNSAKKYWFICQNDKTHEDYEASCDNFTRMNSRCPICNESHGEREISKWLIKNNINYEKEKIFEDLLGIGNGFLRYDFYLPEQNLLIEFQGEQHHKKTGYLNAQNRFEYQQEHDRRKREYAESHNIRLLEIWYWDFDNIEEILNENIK